MENINSNRNQLLDTNNNFPDFLYPSNNLVNFNDEEHLISIENLMGTSDKKAIRYKTIINDLVIKFSSLTGLKQQDAIQNTLRLALKQIDEIDVTNGNRTLDFTDITILERHMNELTKVLYETLGYRTVKFEINLIKIHKNYLDIEYFIQQKEFLENMNSKKIEYFSKQMNSGINEHGIPASVSTFQNYKLHSKSFGPQYPCLEKIDRINNDYEFTQIHISKLIQSRGYQIVCYFLGASANNLMHIIWFEGYNPSIELNKTVNIFNMTDEKIIQRCQELYFNVIKHKIERNMDFPILPEIKEKIKPINEETKPQRKQITKLAKSAPTNLNPNTSKHLISIIILTGTANSELKTPSSAPDRMVGRKDLKPKVLEKKNLERKKATTRK